MTNQGTEVLGRSWVEATFARLGDDRLSERVPGALFDRAGRRQHGLLSAVEGDQIGELRSEIPGAGSFFYAQDLALIGDLVEEFVTGNTPAPVTNRVLASVLFTDLVGSTERASKLGDAAWSELLERHHSQASSAVQQHGGETIKTLGDGVLATFSGPAQAVRCAGEIIAAAEAQALEVRSGVHTGEVEVGGDDISGLAVHLAARIMGQAGPGEILVSRTVRDLVVGSQLRFTDRGEFHLKGVEEPWKLYEVA